jgi:hypothetical protein
MTDQTTSSKSWTQPPDTGRHRSESERPASRAIGAALVAGGLALSVSLYPLPHGPELFDMFTPDQESSSAASTADDSSTFVKYSFSNFPALKLTELVKLAELKRDFPDLAARDLLRLVTTYGLSNVVTSLEVLNSFGPLRPYFPRSSGGVGGGGGAPSNGPVDVLPALVILLEYLKLHPPVLSAPDLLAVVTSVFSTLAVSLGVSDAFSAPPPDAQTWALAAAAEFTPIDAPVSLLPDPSAEVSTGATETEHADAPVPIEAPADPPVATVIETPVSAPVDPPATVPTETPQPAPVEPSSAEESTNVVTHEPDPLTSDPPSSDSSPSAGGSSTDSSGGSSTDSSGGSSSDSGGGSSSDSGGGSSSGE